MMNNDKNPLVEPIEQDNENAFNANRESATNTGVGEKRKGGNKKAGIAVMLLGLLALGIVALPNIIDSFKSEEETPVEKKDNIAPKDYVAPVEEEKEQPKTFSFDDEVQEEPPIKLGDPIPQAEAPQPPKLVKSLTGDMMNKTGSIGSSSAPTSAKQAIEEDQRAVDEAIANANRYLEQGTGEAPKEKIGSSQGDIFSAPTFQASVARKSQYNPNLLLEQGTLIPCALRVRVISNISGQLSCTITENVYSSSGNVLLIDKGSRVNGFYQGGSVGHGSKQLFVVWQEVRTPDHLVIPLNSGSTDELGANGLNGWVDNHFWERFSNAIFLSMILDGNNILLSKMTDTAQKNSENTREAGKEIATTVLEQMGDIKPTLYKNQGDKVGIFVARDVDFSNVYQLKRGNATTKW